MPVHVFAACNFDVDGNGVQDAATDGLLITRYLLGFRGNSLTTGALAIAPPPTRSTPTDIEAFIAAHDFDIDRDGVAKSSSDGLLVSRFLLGLSGAALTQGARGSGSVMSDASIESALTQIRAFSLSDNDCKLQLLGVRNLRVDGETIDNIGVPVGERRNTSVSFETVGGVNAADIGLSVIAGADKVALANTGTSWRSVLDAGVMTAGTQSPITFRVTNTQTGRSADVSGSLRVLAPAYQTQGNITAAGGSVTMSSGELLTFESNSLSSPITVNVTESVSASGKRLLTFNFSDPVAAANLQFRLPYLQPRLAAAEFPQLGAATHFEVPKLFNPSELVEAYKDGEENLHYLWAAYDGYEMPSGGYRIPLHKAKEVSQAFRLATGVTTGLVQFNKVLSVSELRSAMSPPPSAVDVGEYEPVLFVHGFLLGGALGGGRETWRYFPNLITKSSSLYGRKFIPFEFRWKTNAHFRDVAADLASAIELIRARTNKPVHVVAHSFGGVLVRTLLQGQTRGLPIGSTTAADARLSVASLLTLGVPHSGIFRDAKAVSTETPPATQILFAPGQDAASFLFCQQISCHVLGQAVFYSSLDPAAELVLAAERSILDISLEAGQHAASLVRDVGQLPPVPILVGIGLTTNRWSANKWDDGDYLISYRGQRLLPSDTVLTPLRKHTVVGGATVTEAVLGSTRDVGPDTAMSVEEMAEVSRPKGYLHSFMTGASNGEAWIYDTSEKDGEHGFGNEAAPLLYCWNAPTCAHAGYLLFKSQFYVGKINDTGIVHGGGYPTGNNFSGCIGINIAQQDCSFGRDAAPLVKVGGGNAGFDFTKISNSGDVLPATAILGSGVSDWACTLDNVTGLMWEVKTTSGLRNKSHTYSWYNSIDTANNGGNVGAASGGVCQDAGRCDTQKFAEDVNNAGLCGHRDWRMPTLKELIGVSDFGRVNPAMDVNYFPNTAVPYYWTGSPDASNPDFAWYIDSFGGGFFLSTGLPGNGRARINTFPVRLVRINTVGQ